MTYEAFYEQMHPQIVEYLRRKCANLHDAEDLAAECFIYCYQHWDDYDETKASRKTWLYMITRSRWKNYLRGRRTLYTLDGLEEVIPDKDILGQAVWMTAVRDELARMLGELPERQREAVIFRYFTEMEDEEIARRMETTPGNVRILIHRGIKKMNHDHANELRTVLGE